ncbi:DUF7504 family protein [Halobaculum roseum]|uniref:Uncharacterized protein n=1 Tax=Halobaculum roseum TaxID=2175149 RepID=A0ABD5MKM3_9EURY|nr:hypothetical protein [Halobaculum roseum]QZY03118.1 hypothetical protein K6T36_02710 [Halobaculum roseum]
MGADVHGGVGPAIDENWSDGTAMLLEVPGLDPRERVACRRLLPNSDGIARYCRFSFRRSVDDQFTEICRHGDELPDHGVCVQVRGGIGGAFDPTTGGSDEGPLSVQTVTDPSNVTKLGITLTEVIDEAPDDGATAICFDSLTVLLQYVSLEEAIQFVSLTNSIVGGSGGSIHYHVDPSAHETETIGALRQVMDTVVSIDEISEA